MECSGIFQINGTDFSAGIIQLERKAPKLDKYAKRTMDGDLQREVIGTYITHVLTFAEFDEHNPADEHGNIVNEYDRLYLELIRPVDFTTITLPSNKGSFTFAGYISEVKDSIIYVKGSERIFEGLSCEIIPKMPTWRAGNNAPSWGFS